MNKYWRAILEQLSQEHRTCFVCGITVTCPPHHCLFGNKKGKNTSDAIKKFVSDRRNLQDLCQKHHTQLQGSNDNAKKFMEHQIKDGNSEMLAWLDSAPEKIKNSKWRSVYLLATWGDDVDAMGKAR